MSARIPLIYILGSGHSGSTLLSLMLSSHSQIAGVGELCKAEQVWTAAPGSKRCTCDSPLSDCSFWQRVFRDLGRQFQLRPADAMRGDPGRFEQANAVLFDAIVEHSRKKVVCDSSKELPRLQRLLSSNRFDVHITHLVRDGRAVAYSHRAKGKRQSQPRSAFAALRRWSRSNQHFAETVGNRQKYTLVRYEDLVLDPRRQLKRVLQDSGLSYEPAMRDYWQVAHHILSGNHMRFQRERPLEPDVRYFHDVSHLAWSAYSLWACRALRRFGYPMLRSNMESYLLANRSLGRDMNQRAA